MYNKHHLFRKPINLDTSSILCYLDAVWGLRRRPRNLAGWIWLMQQYWNVPDYEQARFDRVLQNASHLSLPESRREQLWQQFTDENIRYILSGLPIYPSWRVLEIGCGVGRLLKALSPHVASVYGVDFSPQMVAFSKRYLDGCPNTTVLENNGRDVAMFRDEIFDACIAVLLFQEIGSLEIMRGYLREAHRVLKPGGWLRFQTRLGPPPLAVRLRGFWKRTEAKTSTRGEIDQMLGEAGLEMVKFETQTFLNGQRWAWVSARRPEF